MTKGDPTLSSGLLCLIVGVGECKAGAVRYAARRVFIVVTVMVIVLSLRLHLVMVVASSASHGVGGGTIIVVRCWHIQWPVQTRSSGHGWGRVDNVTIVTTHHTDHMTRLG